ncbi:VOC family protein [Candidatus Woesearchaeota archaeon]|nr:VOC family protein [Candidatus Woesearchaeota archaeon]
MKFNKLIPELSVADMKKSLEFYRDILGFKVEYTRERFTFLSFQGSQIMIEEIKKGNKERNDAWQTGKLEHPFGRGINFQIEVDDVDAIVKDLQKNNYQIRMMPKENWYKKDDIFVGNREMLVMDPDGYLLRFAEDLGEKKQ